MNAITKTNEINTNAAALSITVDDGMRAIPITNTLGTEIGKFYFRPTDIGIIDRYNEIIEKVPDVFKPLENININADGTADSDVEMQTLKECESKLYELCDYLFNGNLSEAFFGSMHPFSPLDSGMFYCENALDSVGKFIAAQFQRSVKGVEKRISGYTKGYKSAPGKHRKA